MSNTMQDIAKKIRQIQDNFELKPFKGKIIKKIITKEEVIKLD